MRRLQNGQRTILTSPHVNRFSDNVLTIEANGLKIWQARRQERYAIVSWGYKRNLEGAVRLYRCIDPQHAGPNGSQNNPVQHSWRPSKWGWRRITVKRNL